MVIYCTYSGGFGGVGKTTIALTVARLLNYHDKKPVILIDLDYETKMLSRVLFSRIETRGKDQVLVEQKIPDTGFLDIVSCRDVDLEEICRAVKVDTSEPLLIFCPGSFSTDLKINSKIVSSIFKVLHQFSDYVIIDLPTVHEHELSTLKPIIEHVDVALLITDESKMYAFESEKSKLFRYVASSKTIDIINKAGKEHNQFTILNITIPTVFSGISHIFKVSTEIIKHYDELYDLLVRW